MRGRDLVDLFALGFLWGASFLFMRIAGPEFGALALVEVRVAIAALVLLPLLLARGLGGELIGNWAVLGVLGIHNTALPFLLLTWATLYLTAGTSGILNATAPIFAAIIAWAWLGERLTISRTAGLLVGTVGVWLLVRDKVGASMGDTTLAVVAALGGSFLYGIGGNFTRRYASHVKPLAIATGSQIGAALVLLPIAVVTWPDTPISLTAWAAAITMGLFSTALAYILYFRLIANIGPTGAITVTYLIPVSAMLLGALVINEPITGAMVFGGAVILLGTALATGMLRLPGAGR
ncbi:MAG: DMT family transporter [Gammaproteobacteria bacterium]|nr:DMT family transporter [Gammaproteobacteria bacterium]MDH5618947.1 DMT family transporter [Gammaproteobacteria bacterium]